MENIQIIKTGIDTTSILRQLKEYAKDWNCQDNIQNADSLLKYGFPAVDIGVLQLKIGVVPNTETFVGNTQTSKETPAWNRHTAVRTTLKKNGFPKLERCGFLAMPIGGEVGRHIDLGDYYLTRDRYHLAIQGTYLYTVGSEEYNVEAGTIFKFNNKLEHAAKNTSNITRITFVFDILMGEYDNG